MIYEQEEKEKPKYYFQALTTWTSESHHDSSSLRSTGHISSVHALTTGVDCEMVSRAEMEPIYCNDKDIEWLMECLQEDVAAMGAIEPWI